MYQKYSYNTSSKSLFQKYTALKPLKLRCSIKHEKQKAMICNLTSQILLTLENRKEMKYLKKTTVPIFKDHF